MYISRIMVKRPARLLAATAMTAPAGS